MTNNNDINFGLTLSGGARGFAVTAGISAGNAVKRNRAKRIIRAAMREFIQDIKPGYNGVLIARKPLTESNCRETKEALESLFRKAEILLTQTNE